MSQDLDALAATVQATRPSAASTPAEQVRHAQALLAFAQALQPAQYFRDGAEASAEAIALFNDRIEAGDETLSPDLAAALLVHANCLHGLGLGRAVSVFQTAAGPEVRGVLWVASRFSPAC
ncbi:hypothetical protein [Enhygromyxa salina]|nr:hypothetical protein [Enhygromyxa salina]